MTDAVNLRYRHPKLWARLDAGQVADWIAAKTARMVAAAGLDVNKARWVDTATHGAAAELPPSRYFALVEAKIIEVDVVAAERRREAFELARFVRTGQATEHGTKTLVARAAAGDVIFFDAMVARIAEILRLRGDDDSLDVRRSKAIGFPATPARAVQLLAWAETVDEDLPDGHPDLDPEDEPVRYAATSESLGSRASARSRSARLGSSCGTATSRLSRCSTSRASGRSTATRSRREWRRRSGSRWPLVQPSHGVHLWRAPSGYWVRIDHRGTHHRGKHVSVMEEQFRALLGSEAPAA